MSLLEELPVVVVGAGPVGLAAAAHLVERNLPVVVLETGRDVAANLQSWGHVQLFSPWKYNVDSAATRLLEAEGWKVPTPDLLPTGFELAEQYLVPLARIIARRGSLRLNARVMAVSKQGMDKVRTKGRETTPFVVRYRSTEGQTEEVLARAVVDASGTWGTPNQLGANGLPAKGEEALGERIHYGIPDVLGAHRARYAGKRTLVVGAGHSAANSILSLAKLADESPGTGIVWATRGSNLARVFGGGEADGLPARGQLGSDLQRLITQEKLALVQDFAIEGVETVGSKVRVVGARAGQPFVIEDVDAVIAATGQRPDLQMAREMRVSLDPSLESVAALAPLIDPNEHSCGTVRPHGAAELAQPEPNFYVVGAKSYGRAPTFLLATGYEQARSVVAMLAGDREAAARVELNLPETGVCSSQPLRSSKLKSACGPGGSCC